MGEEIINKENYSENIELLAAQKQLYIIAKRVFALQIILTSVIVVALSIINLFTDTGKLLSVYSVLIAFLDLLLIKDLIKNYKDKAAKIQEQFDTIVLSIPPNTLIEKVDLEEIGRYARKHKEIDPTYSKLKNWYSISIKEINNSIAKIVCQRSNFVYDYTLRKNYNLALSILIGAMCLTVIVLAIINESNLIDFFLVGVLPILPILMLFVQVLKDNKNSNTNLVKLKQVANESWNKVLNNQPIDISQTSRNLQDMIYQNRINSPLIFEWFYNLKRKQLEDEMYYSVDRLVAEYKVTSA
ncbi:hypothetical protein CXF68_06360 [Tenacibaculum sp. Bg11-29]|uniref:S-4TM family putative pore-forming effector n=1 Tax=Tenacibaculum sp. Bg11-29 TaxID=2058306 RepID=UPI000C332342|nr:S-4TM family putative pore-forming effector [Tenacibaculum sp. Bg11-29]PKH50345.1 hypothetical protein CXF68_06360 [Tenacibaculum sp. Bg11-29]